jgi:hypothetical protein
MAPSKLTVLQLRTQDHLEKKDFSSIKSGQVASYVGKALSVSPSNLERHLSAVMGFYKATTKLTNSQIFKKITNSFDNSKLTKFKEVVQEAKSDGLFSGFGEGDNQSQSPSIKERLASGEVPIQAIPVPEEKAPQPEPRPSSKQTDLPFGKTAEDLIRRVNDVGKEGGKLIGESLKEGITGLIKAPSDAFHLGNEVYKDNKKEIDFILSKLNKESAEDGSLLAGLASLAVPEIALLQGAVDSLGLAFDADDTKILDKMLSTSPLANQGISTKDALTTYLKAMVNPQQMAKILQTSAKHAGTQLSDNIIKAWETITGKKPVASGLQAPPESNVAVTDSERTHLRSDFEGQLLGQSARDVGRAEKFQDDKLVSRLLDGMVSTFDFGGLSKNDVSVGISRLKRDPENRREMFDIAKKWLPSGATKIKNLKEFLTALPESARSVFSSEIASTLNDNLKKVNVFPTNPVKSIEFKPDPVGAVVPVDDASKKLFSQELKLYQPFLDGMNRIIQGKRNADESESTSEQVSMALKVRDQILAITGGSGDISNKVAHLDNFMSGLKEGVGGFQVPKGIVTAIGESGKGFVDKVKTVGSDIVTKLTGDKGTVGPPGSSPVPIGPSGGSGTGVPRGGAVRVTGSGGAPVITLPGDIGGPIVAPATPEILQEERGANPERTGTIKEKKINPSTKGVPRLRTRFPAGGADAEIKRDPEEVAKATRVLEASLQEEKGFGNGENNTLFLRQQYLSQMEFVDTPIIDFSPKVVGTVDAKTEGKLESEWILPAESGAERSMENDMVNSFATSVFNNFEPDDIQTVYPRMEMLSRRGDYPDLALRWKNSDELGVQQQTAGFKAGYMAALNNMKVMDRI